MKKNLIIVIAFLYMQTVQTILNIPVGKIQKKNKSISLTDYSLSRFNV